jgi:hypothetical protein
MSGLGSWGRSRRTANGRHVPAAVSLRVRAALRSGRTVNPTHRFVPRSGFNAS